MNPNSSSENTVNGGMCGDEFCTGWYKWYLETRRYVLTFYVWYCGLSVAVDPGHIVHWWLVNYVVLINQ